MVIPNQGYRKDLNLQETKVDKEALDNLGGAGISNDLSILQNNLRNTSVSVVGASVTAIIGPGGSIVSISASNTQTGFSKFGSGYTGSISIGVTESGHTGLGASVTAIIGVGGTLSFTIVDGGTGYVSPIITISPNVSPGTVSNGFFDFGSSSTFVFTNDDVVTVNTDVNVGSSTLFAGTYYYVCNSNAENRFKLSTTPSSVGLNIITVTSTSPNSFYFIRKDAVDQSNLINFIKPDIQDTTDFSYLNGASVNGAFNSSQSNNEVAKYIITGKYKTNQDSTSTLNDFKYEGIVTVNDPVSLNINQTGLDNAKSPGVFIGNTRAFSSDNNPWNQVGTALSTSSNEVSVGELFFSNDIYITGINTESATSTAITTFSHKLPVIINGETYYLLLKTS